MNLPRNRCANININRPPTCNTPLTADAGVATGEIRVHGDASEIAVGDTIVIEYTPCANSPLLDNDTAGILLWTGGFNGWKGLGSSEDDGSSQTLHFPFTPLLDGKFRISITVPDYATSVDFCVTSSANSWLWDDNSGDMYIIPVKYRKKMDKEGKVEEYVADKGIEIKRDAKAEENTSPVMMPEEEEVLHRIRGEASLVGEEKGLGSILISQARDVFERFDHSRKGIILVTEIPAALKELSFELSDEETKDLIKQYVKDDTICTMVEWMIIYSELELSDYGIQMV